MVSALRGVRSAVITEAEAASSSRGRDVASGSTMTIVSLGASAHAGATACGHVMPTRSTTKKHQLSCLVRRAFSALRALYGDPMFVLTRKRQGGYRRADKL